MKFLNKILKTYLPVMEEIGTGFDGVKYGHSDEDCYKAVEKWLKQYKKYLPPADVTEHAKGAHDAVNELLRWILAPEKMEAQKQ